MKIPRTSSASALQINDLNERSREVFRRIVESYVETGEPVGSRTLSRSLGIGVSPATIRNVMADLEDLGLLFSPHTSAGRLPTDLGLRMFVDGLLELGNLTQEEQAQIEGQCAGAGKSMPEVLEDAVGMVSGLSRCAGLVVAPKASEPLKHIEFVSLGPGRALVVLVTASGQVENRLIDVPMGLPAASLVEASNYLSSRLIGRTIDEAKAEIAEELNNQRAQLNELTSRVVEAGLATYVQEPGSGKAGALIVRGQAQLLDDVTAIEDLERIREIFAALETKEALSHLLDLTDSAQGVQIFIGSENQLFGATGCSVVIAPYSNSQQNIVGAVGVIGPTRLNYAKIIPMVDFTSKMISRLIG
ncbi:MAG: heat-inducible transcriptional repressor HrcA [Pseudomonadota bacterium]